MKLEKPEDYNRFIAHIEEVFQREEERHEETERKVARAERLAIVAAVVVVVILSALGLLLWAAGL